MILMTATVLLLAAFEGYWLHKLYKDEHAGLKKEVDISFRETMNKLQLSRFEKDTTLIAQNITVPSPKVIAYGTTGKKPKKDSGKIISAANVLYRTINGPIELNNIPADSIQSVSVFKSGFSFKGAPNPALIELIMKQAKSNARDSFDRIIVRFDSTMKEEINGKMTSR